MVFKGQLSRFVYILFPSEIIIINLRFYSKNMTKQIPYFFIVIAGLILVSSCSFTKKKTLPFEGKLVYKITSPLNTPDRDSSNYQIVYAKDSMLRIDSYTSIGKQIYIKHIPKDKAYILMDVGAKKVAIQTIADTTRNDQRYEFSKKSGKTKLAGRKAKNIRVKDKVQDTTIVMNYLPEISAKYSTAIEGMPGLPAKYDLFTNGVWITYKLNKINEKDLNIDLFGIPSDHEIVTLEEFIDLID